MNSIAVPGGDRTLRRARRTRRASAKFGGVGRPSPSTWVAAFAVEKPKPPAAIASSSTRLHRRELLGRRGVARRGLAHHGATDRRVADEEADVRTQRLRVDDVEELGIGAPAVLEPGFERRHRDRLDPGEKPVSHDSSPGATGASVRPQFPPITVVTPWSGDGESTGS